MMIESNGLKFNCRLEGAENAPCVVFSHGLGADLTMWDDLIDAFHVSGYRTLRYDTRGHGKTPAAPGPYTLEQLGEDLIGILDTLGLDRVHLVGLSMGGMLGMGLALNHGQRLLSLSVCDAVGEAVPAYQAALLQRCEIVRTGGVEAVMEASLAVWFAEPFQGDEVKMEKVRTMFRRTSQEGYIGCATALSKLDFKRHLHRIEIPTFFLVGSLDAGAPPEVMRDMHKRVVGSSYNVIDGAAHMSAIEKPDDFVTSVLNFLKTSLKGEK